MNILIACYNPRPHSEPENKYLPELVDALVALGHNVVWSQDEFWNPTREYDIVHLQWPEGVVDGGCGGNALNAVKWRLKCWRDRGVKIVLTRHNENRHYAASGIYAKLYRNIEEMCDGIIHMGNYSKDTLAKVLDNKSVKHFVIPHHVYPSVNRNLGQLGVRKELGMSTEDKIVLAFGAFRADEERELVLAAAKALKRYGVKVIAPQLFSDSIRRGNKWERYFALRHRLRFLKYGLHLSDYGRVTEERMGLLFSACDVVLIPRLKILNSGNLAMGFYFGKVVVGPDRGNVGEILRQSGNPAFDPDDSNSVVSGVLDGLRMAREGVGEKNKRLADMNWSVQVVAEQTVAAYQSLLNG